MAEALVLHEYAASGNCYKIRLAAALTGHVLTRRAYDILAGETRTPGFLAEVNPDGRIPVLQVGTRYLPESNAACLWLAEGTPLVPEDRFDRADMMRWLFWEQYGHEPNIATLRFWLAFLGESRLTPLQQAQLAPKRAAGEAALDLMERHLADRAFLVADRPSVADVALYAYTHVAGEGGFDLAGRPGVRAWLDRVAALPGYIPLAA